MKSILILTVAFLISACSTGGHDSSEHKTTAKPDNRCEVSGPQTPRDISSKVGTNKVSFAKAPDYKKMNLCNIHFHKQAEHKGPEFSIPVPATDNHGGFACNRREKLSPAQLRPVKDGACKGIQAGDTIEVHWVHTTCDIKPGPTLGACLSEDCQSPDLRVETQVFILVNDPKAASFADYANEKKVNGFYQAKSLPSRKGAIEFLGSTTGPSFNDKECSPFKVNWSVTPNCQTLDINSLHQWCQSNVFNEDYAHGVRKLVVNPSMLSPIE